MAAQNVQNIKCNTLKVHLLEVIELYLVTCNDERSGGFEPALRSEAAAAAKGAPLKRLNSGCSLFKLIYFIFFTDNLCFNTPIKPSWKMENSFLQNNDYSGFLFKVRQ